MRQLESADPSMLAMANAWEQGGIPGYVNAQQMRVNPGLSVRFSFKAVENKEKSLEAGRKIFEDKEFVRIATAADRNTVIEREVTARDRVEFGQIYAAFKAKQDQTVAAGTRLEVLADVVPAILKMSQVEEFKSVGIFTAEQLGAMSDNEVARWMGGVEIRKQVRNYLEACAKAAPMGQLKDMNDKLTERLDAQDQQMKAQQDLIDQLTRKLAASGPLEAPAKIAVKQTTKG